MPASAPVPAIAAEPASQRTRRRTSCPGYDDQVTDTDTPSSSESPTPPVPGEQRRLAHPPSDRYRAAETRSPADGDRSGGDQSASVARGVAIATALALVGAAAIVVLGGVATVTTGLIVVAGAIGFGVAVALQLGAGGHLSPGDGSGSPSP